MMAFINCIYVASAFLNFYYLYNLSNMIRLKYLSIHEADTSKADTSKADTRGEHSVNYVNNPYMKSEPPKTQLIREGEVSPFKMNNFPEMHMQTRQPQPRLIQMNYDNNTASIYKYVTNLHVVGLF